MRVINKFEWLNKTGTNAEKWGVNKRGRVIRKLMLFSGTGRTGSKTIALWFKKHKIEVLHEKTGEYGSSTHFYHSDHKWYPMYPWYNGRTHIGERLSDFDFEYRYHIVRNPLTCIPSIGKIFCSLEFILLQELDMIPKIIKTKLHRCMWVYNAINHRLENQIPKNRRVKLEELNKIIPMVKKDTGIILNPELKPHSNKGSGFRMSAPVTWDDMMKEDKLLTTCIKNMSKRYGYEV